MDGTASVHDQQDIPSRQAIIYLLTMGWFLAHTSLDMTPEQSATCAENLQHAACQAACLSEGDNTWPGRAGFARFVHPPPEVV